MSSCEIAINEACLPGGYFAIAAVVPESITHLCDFDRWEHVGLPAPVIEGGALTARVSERDAYKTKYAYKKVVAVEPGKYYAVRAAMRRDPDTWGYLEGTLNKSGQTTRSEPPIGGAWEVVAFVVKPRLATPTGEPADTQLEIALKSAHAGGPEPGAVQVKDVALLELVEDYGQYWRVTLLNPEIPVTYAAFGVRVYDKIGAYAESYAIDTTDLEPKETSTTWVDMGARLPSGSASFGLVFSERNTGIRLKGACVRLEVAYKPNEASVVVNRTIYTSNGAIGLVGSGRPNPLRFASSMVTVAEYIAQDPAAFRARPGYTPAPLLEGLASLSDQPAGWSPEWGDPDGFLPLLDFWRDLGLNGIGELQLAEHEGPADTVGINFRYLKYWPPRRWKAPAAPYEIDTLLPAELEVEWEARSPSTRATFERYASVGNRLLVELFDEAAGLNFAGDHTYHDSFRAYLQEKMPTCTPATFGKTSWDDVLGLTTAELDIRGDQSRPDHNPDYGMPDSAGPDAAPDREAAMLYYWRQRWWNEATCRMYAKMASFLRTKFGTLAPLPILCPQIPTPIGGDGGGYRNGIELQTLLNAGGMFAGGMTGFIGQAFFSGHERCWAQQASTYADWVDGHISPYGLDRRCALVHFKRGAGAQKALALAAHGMQYINWFTYGPWRVGTSDGRAGRGADSMRELQIVQDGSRALAIAAPAIAGAKRVTGPVAIVAPQNDQLWNKSAPDVLALGYTATLGSVEIATHLALSHGHHPVRFLAEERLPEDLGADTKVLLLHRRHLSNAAFLAINNWVRNDGGTLIVIGEIPTRDEHAQRAADRFELFGITADPALEAQFQDYTVNFGENTEVTMQYPRRTVAPGGTVLASYDEESGGGAAVVEVARDAGKVRIVGFALSRLYIDDTDCEDTEASELPSTIGRFPVYKKSVRDAILGLVGPVERPAWTSEPLVEVVRMKRNDGGESLVLLNYTNNDIEPLTVNVPSWNGTPAWKGTARALFANVDVAFNSGVASVALKDDSRDVEVLKLVP